MSGRPRTSPNRFVPGQATTATKSKTVKTESRTQKSVKSGTAATARTGVLPSSKDGIIKRLIPLISQVTNDEDLQNFLISLYDETSNDNYTRTMFGEKTEDHAKDTIAKHVKLFSKLYRGSKPEMTFTLKGDDMINLAYLMYLDMLHDETIKTGMTFQTFCKEDIEVSVKVPAPTKKDKKATKMEKKTQKSPVYILFGTGLEPKETVFIKRIQDIIGQGKAETEVKNNLVVIYPEIKKTERIINRDQVTPNILQPGQNMFMSIDQEDEKATVTLDIEKTKYTKGEGKNAKTAKVIYPLVSVANLMDPGKNMLIESAKEDSKYFMGALGNRDIQSRLTWNYNQPKFTIEHDEGTTTIEAYYTDDARITNKNRKTKRGYAYRITNGKDEKYRLPSNMSKTKAQTGSTGEKVAKFFGDFLQALTVVSYINNNDNPNYHYCLATGDAMLANNFIFLCTKSRVSPNLWMAVSSQQVSKVYGEMTENFQIAKPAVTTVTNAPNKRNGNTDQEVLSGKSNNRGFLRRIFGGKRTGARSVGNNTTSAAGSSSGSMNTNNGGNIQSKRTPQPTKGKRMNTPKPTIVTGKRKRANNTMSVAGSSSGSVYTNNNGNNAQSKPIKRNVMNTLKPVIMSGKRKRVNNIANENMRPPKRRQVNATPTNRQRVATPKQSNNRPQMNTTPTNRQRVATPKQSNNRQQMNTTPVNRQRVNSPQSSFVTASSGNLKANNNLANNANSQRKNTTRNNLIRYLQNKKIPNFFKNVYIKQYNNGEKNVNQIKSEANNFERRRA